MLSMLSNDVLLDFFDDFLLLLLVEFLLVLLKLKLRLSNDVLLLL